MSDPTVPAGPLHPLPAQPAGVPFPVADWPTGPVPSGLDLGAWMDAAFDPDGPLHDTYAVVCVLGGRLVCERYGGTLPRLDGPGRAVTAETPLLSWSVAKSCLHTVVGMLVGDGVLDVDALADVPAWSGSDDPRRAITLADLLSMRDGLDFREEYVDAGVSDVIEMLFGRGQADMATFAEDRPLAVPPGTRFNYSTGTSVVISGIVARALGPGEPYREFLDGRLFGPLGMTSAAAGFDDAGTWVAGSYLHATARDFARFGLFALRDGTWDGRGLLPAGWIDDGRAPLSVDPDDGSLYGRHWWTRSDRFGTFFAAGHEGQFIDVVPDLDLVLVRLGRTETERLPEVETWRNGVIAAVAEALGR